MQQIHEQIELVAPVGGLHRAAGYQHKAPYYFENGLNVRAYDVIEGRGRIGSRPGLVKPYAQNVSVDGVVTEEYTLSPILLTKGVRIEGHSSTDDANWYGSFGTLNVGNDSGALNPLRSLLHFDLSGIPGTTAVITAASLNLYCFSATGTTAAKLYRMTRYNWGETTATWNKYDGSTTWTTAGGDFTTSGGVDFTTIAPGWLTISGSGVIAMAQEAYGNLTDHIKQLHMLLKLASETATIEQNSYGGREYPTVDRRAYMSVTYEVTV